MSSSAQARSDRRRLRGFPSATGCAATRQRRDGLGLVRRGPRARPQRRDQAARRALRRRRAGGAPLHARGARGGAARRPSPRGDDLRRRRHRIRSGERGRRQRPSSSWSTSPAARSPTRSASAPCAARTRSAGSARRPPRSITPTPAASCTATSSRPTSCSTATASCRRRLRDRPLVAEHTITNTGELLGTAAYISPEQALGPPASEASDRYALAVAAFELLTGERPFTAPHFAAQARQHIEDEPPRASDATASSREPSTACSQRGMAKQAVDRCPTAADFTSALRDAIERPQPARAAAIESPADARVHEVQGRPRRAGRSPGRWRRARGRQRVPALAALGRWRS